MRFNDPCFNDLHFNDNLLGRIESHFSVMSAVPIPSDVTEAIGARPCSLRNRKSTLQPSTASTELWRARGLPPRLELRYFTRRKSMNRALIAVFAIPLLCGSLLGQSPQSLASGSTSPAQATASSAPAGSASRIAPGSVIPVQLTKSIDAKKAKQGDEVIAKVTQDIRNNAGTVGVPKDTKVFGHVTEAQARSKQQKESHVAIVFDHAVLKNGEQMPIPMSIQAVIAPPSPFPATANFGTERSSGYPGTPSPTAAGVATNAPGGTAAQMPNLPQDTSSAPAGIQAQSPITGKTQGVVGIPNLKLSAAPDPAQGSLVSSEKENVRLDGGTFLLLRVK
jgi:hypothetical protein